MISREEARGRVGGQIALIVLYLVLYIMVNVVVSLLLVELSIRISEGFIATKPYIDVALLAIFGYLILRAISDAVFYLAYARQGEISAAAALKNATFLIGVGALIVIVIGATVGGVTAVALAGFLALVIGYATQQVLSHVLAGFFLILVRPFKIMADRVSLAGDEGTVQEVGIVYTKIAKQDGTIVLIPNGSIVNNKVYILTEKK